MKHLFFLQIIFQWIHPINCTAPLGINYPLQSIYLNGLIPKSNFGQIQDQSKFRIISPSGIINEDSQKI